MMRAWVVAARNRSLNAGKFPASMASPRAADEAEVEMQIVEGKQPQSEDFPGPEEVADVGAGEAGDVRVARTRRAAAGRARTRRS